MLVCFGFYSEMRLMGSCLVLLQTPNLLTVTLALKIQRVRGSHLKLPFLQEGPVSDGISSGKLVLQKKGLKGVLPEVLQFRCIELLEFDSYQRRVNFQGCVRMSD